MAEFEPNRLSSNPPRLSMADFGSNRFSSNPYRESTSEFQSKSTSSNPYRASMRPDYAPTMDVPDQSWSDSATNIPEEEEEASEHSTLAETQRGTPSPTETKADDEDAPPPPPQHFSKHVLRKIKRLVKKRGKEIEFLTVFTETGDIVCSHEAPNRSNGHPTYAPNAAEGEYIRLALLKGLKRDGCPFEFGNVNWLSGAQEQQDEKWTLKGLPDGEHPGDGPHQFYGVLSFENRYIFATVLREGPSGVPSPKAMKKIRALADKLEAYELWAAEKGFIAKMAAKF